MFCLCRILYVSRCDVFCTGLHVRFAGLLTRLSIAPPSDLSGGTKDLGFNDEIFFMAAALDPNFGFRWLEDLPDTADSSGAKEQLRQHVIGIFSLFLLW